MRFSDIQGHDDIKRRIRDMVDSDRIPHALLIEGPAGTGKFMMARAMAQYIHCEDRRDGEPCGVCPACLQHQSLNHIDTYYSYPVVKRKSGSPAYSEDFAEQWRKFVTDSPYMDFDVWLTLIDNINAKPVIYVDESEMIARQLNYTARKSRYRIVMIWLPERMNADCANKLLKMIEEPAPGSVFIMVSNEPARILPTIYSRMQRIEMLRLSDSDLSAILQREYGVQADRAAELAVNAQGNVITAIRRLSDDGRQGEYLNMFISLMRLAYQRQVRELKQWSTDVAATGREQIMDLMAYCQRMVRENFIYNLNMTPLRNLRPDEQQFSSRFARFITHRNAERIDRAFAQAASDIAANGNPKIVLFDLAVCIIMLIRQ